VKPSGPMRMQLNLLVLFAALGAGIGLAVLLALLHPRIATREVLEKIADVRVIGAITVTLPAITCPWYRRPAVLVAGAVSLLLAVFTLNQVLSEPLRAMLRGATS